jgi:hypothetical protein
MALIQKSDYQVGKCCNRRKLPTLVLKLDFAKAFDSVDWDCLTDVMVKRGFPQLGANGSGRCWQRPRSLFLSMARLDRGSPCKCGLQQGDPL